MASQTGYFSIPVKCLTKKCLVTADKTSVEFGGICVGETVRRRITLRNEGAISTNFQITDKLSQPLDMPSLKVGRLLNIETALIKVSLHWLTCA